MARQKPKSKHVTMAELAWDQYSQEFPPVPGYTWTSRRLFLAGYGRGRACTIGLAWIYCVLVSILCALAMAAYFILK